MNDHEAAFVSSFIVRSRRGRYEHLLSAPKRRAEFCDRLCHALQQDLDERYCYDERALPDDVVRDLESLRRHAPESWSRCYVLCDDPQLDARTMPFQDAESAWDHMSPIVISVVPGKLAYYRPEPINHRFVLLRASQAVRPRAPSSLGNPSRPK